MRRGFGLIPDLFFNNVAFQIPTAIPPKRPAPKKTNFYSTPAEKSELTFSIQPTFTIWDPKIACLNRSKLL